jgi:hypothetical protein
MIMAFSPGKIEQPNLKPRFLKETGVLSYSRRAWPQQVLVNPGTAILEVTLLFNGTPGTTHAVLSTAIVPDDIFGHFHGSFGGLIYCASVVKFHDWLPLVKG